MRPPALSGLHVSPHDQRRMGESGLPSLKSVPSPHPLPRRGRGSSSRRDASCTPSPLDFRAICRRNRAWPRRSDLHGNRMSSSEDPRQAQLRRMKAIALAMLLAMVAGFVTAHVMGNQGVWAWVSAFCEAATVGALADWFAVVALFRHPLGL